MQYLSSEELSQELIDLNHQITKYLSRDEFETAKSITKLLDFINNPEIKIDNKKDPIFLLFQGLWKHKKEYANVISKAISAHIIKIYRHYFRSNDELEVLLFTLISPTSGNIFQKEEDLLSLSGRFSTRESSIQIKKDLLQQLRRTESTHFLKNIQQNLAIHVLRNIDPSTTEQLHTKIADKIDIALNQHTPIRFDFNAWELLPNHYLALIHLLKICGLPIEIGEIIIDSNFKIDQFDLIREIIEKYPVGSLDCSCLSKFNSTNFDQFINLIKSSNIESLTLNADDVIFLSEEQIKQLAEAISQSPTLESITLNYFKSVKSASAKDIAKLSSLISAAAIATLNLPSWKLIYHFFPETSASFFEALQASSVKSLSLTNWSIFLGNDEFKDSFMPLVKYLQAGKLETLDLTHFAFLSVGEKIIDQFFNALKKSSIKNLKLKMWPLNILKEHAKNSLHRYLETSQLEELDMSGTIFNNDNSLSIMNPIAKSSIKVLRLANSGTLFEYHTHFVSMTSLQELDIRNAGLDGLKSTSLNNVLEDIKKTSLTILRIGFERLDSINMEKFNNIISILEPTTNISKSLRVLDLRSISDVKNLSIQQWDALINVLNQNKTLETICFTYPLPLRMTLLLNRNRCNNLLNKAEVNPNDISEALNSVNSVLKNIGTDTNKQDLELRDEILKMVVALVSKQEIAPSAELVKVQTTDQSQDKKDSATEAVPDSDIPSSEIRLKENFEQIIDNVDLALEITKGSDTYHSEIAKIKNDIIFNIFHHNYIESLTDNPKPLHCRNIFTEEIMALISHFEPTVSLDNDQITRLDSILSQGIDKQTYEGSLKLTDHQREMLLKIVLLSYMEILRPELYSTGYFNPNRMTAIDIVWDTTIQNQDNAEEMKPYLEVFSTIQKLCGHVIAPKMQSEEPKSAVP